MLTNAKRQITLKALLLVGLALFLLTRITSGALYFYISERFAWLTLAAVAGLFVLGISYWFGTGQKATEEACHCGDEHEPGCTERPGHTHSIGWLSALIVALPILLGLLTPPRPLGSNALAVRELSVSGLSSALPAAVQGATAKPDTERTVLDWVLAFQAGRAEGEEFDGRAADVIGFVHREDGSDDAGFWLTRYVVGCCVADAAPVGLRVDWPDGASLAADSWVRVQGVLAEEVGAQAPVMKAREVVVVPPPNQPYLYP